ncbi:hypothetical protein NUW54_g9520 [Trametes sanguinea]|uniref:Uncharacterized protein n=1 Tax=Trametes sanguinea TaxID=158606 RepID=A0ACC1P5C8_9APHY|nr:hypothetical protein NUW54_g9520 [Trametes sanguinea]
MAIPLFPCFRWAVIIAIATFGAHAGDITVDDSNSAISYSPADQWSQGISCSDCTIHPDASEAFDGTWHDTTYNPLQSSPMTITFSFTGTAIQVFNILPPVVPSAPTTHTDLTFILDDLVVSSYQADPASGADFQYNVKVFSQDNLVNKAHTLVIQTTSGIESVVLFDHLVYTVPDPQAVAPSPPPITNITPDPPVNVTTPTTSIKVVTVSSSRGSSSSTSSISLPPSTSSAPIPSSGSSISSQATTSSSLLSPHSSHPRSATM